MEQASTPARERFEALFERYHADVAAYVRRRAPNSIAEDVVGETFLVAWRSLERVHGDPLPPSTRAARRAHSSAALSGSRCHGTWKLKRPTRVLGPS